MEQSRSVTDHMNWGATHRMANPSLNCSACRNRNVQRNRALRGGGGRFLCRQGDLRSTLFATVRLWLDRACCGDITLTMKAANSCATKSVHLRVLSTGRIRICVDEFLSSAKRFMLKPDQIIIYA